VTHDYVLQCNQSDWAFLQERAQRIGYEVFVDHKILYFRPHQYAQGKKQSLTLGDTLYEFFPRSTTMNQIDKIGVKGWFPKEKKDEIAEAKVGKEGNIMGGKMAGVKAVKKAFGTSNYSIVDQPFHTKAEADEMATGQFQNMAIAYITGEGKCLGNADLKVSEVVEITGIGKRFSGLYYLTSVEHHYDASTSYTSSFTVRRNAL
jgi:phage protein D